MAYIRTIVKGTIGTQEVWSCNINWSIFGLEPDSPDQSETDGILAGLLAAGVTAWWPANLRNLVSSGGAITGWRVEKRAEDESTLNVSEGQLAVAVSGSTGPTKTPQDALCFSLRTTTPGPRGRGRLFWPALGSTLDASFRLSSPTTTAALTDMKGMLNNIGTVMNAYYAGISAAKTVVLAVRSGTDHTSRSVTTIKVGNVLDTMRRRRDALTETYATVSYP